MTLNFPVWKYKEGEKPVWVVDMVQDAMLGPGWVEGPEPDQEQVLDASRPPKRGPGRPPAKKE